MQCRHRRRDSGDPGVDGAFDGAEGEIVAFRSTGKSILPTFFLSFVVPSLALSLVRETQS
jgi:hypothetical protein